MKKVWHDNAWKEYLLSETGHLTVLVNPNRLRAICLAIIVGALMMLIDWFML